MRARYRLIRRGSRSGAFYCVDTETGQRSSLGAITEEDAREIVTAKNQARRQPMLNLQIAKAYLAGVDTAVTTRTWQHAIEALINTKHGANQILNYVLIHLVGYKLIGHQNRLNFPIRTGDQEQRGDSAIWSSLPVGRRENASRQG